MPIYVYKCTTCSTIFEVLTRGKKETIYYCPKCGSKQTTKQVSELGYRRDHTVLEN